MESLSRRRALALGSGAALGTAGILAGAAGADAARARADGPESAGNWQRLVVVTANVGRDHRDERERAIRDVRHAVSIDGELAAPLVGWQEIGEGDDDGKEAGFIRKHFGSSFHNLFVGDKVAGHVPISVPRTFNVVDRRVTFAHGGKADVSPHRVITEAVLELAADPQVRFVFANTHYVAGAWNGKNDPAEAWRIKMWRRHFRKHRDDVLKHWHDKGYPVIWTGDVNRSPMPLLVPKKENRAFPRGIDQIAWLPGTNGTELRLKRTASVPMHVDGHDARVAVMQIRRG
ncbi:hypothetical protein G4Z16_31595 [Streptomyces bathyalis]|uniref:Endonuclease/exonuclease/phosphatase domain-containing protein n=1 Tax=Streptomyces bathyalis TaxID=2710756 RepID=A0A7T1TC88_9ACTN|nr:hypothetical protein [Streptomyces bathyalis]QPP10220.1 hypothetical protein G4Z16_31595 [Streptomyces bathyalis]